jgi:hypothetical protein
MTQEQLTEEQLNEIGLKLAKWSDHHRRMISINGKPINRGAEMCVRTATGGFMHTSVQWGRTILEVHEKKPSMVGENLRGIIEQSCCKVETLLAYVSKLNDRDWLAQLTAEDLAEALACLGSFTFTPV